MKAKAEKDGAAVEAALAYVLTGQTNYARSVRKRLMNEAREYLRHYEKLDRPAEALVSGARRREGASHRGPDFLEGFE